MADTSEPTPHTLAPHHLQLLTQASAISPQVIAERGYWTATDWTQLDGLHFRSTQKRLDCFPVLVIPQYDVAGNYTYSTIRYDVPWTARGSDRVVRYLNPAGVGLRLDVPPRCVAGLRDPSRELWWTEGAKKADALASRGVVAVNTPGVQGWRSPSSIPDLIGSGIAFKGRDAGIDGRGPDGRTASVGQEFKRRVIVAYDSDVLSNPKVRGALDAIVTWLGGRGADPYVIDWADVHGI